jgi:hypothetical protein
MTTKGDEKTEGVVALEKHVQEAGVVWLDNWHKTPDGFLQAGRRRSVGEVLEQLSQFLPDNVEYGFRENWNLWENEPWPKGRIFFSVTVGGSEGYYLHVLAGEPLRTVGLAKTLWDRDGLWAAARKMTESVVD